MTLGWAGLTVALAGGAAWRVLPRPVTALLTSTVARPPLTWWMVAVAAIVVAVVAWGATTGLLHVANAAKDPAAAQVEAIKTGLSIAAGTGGVFALLLAVRRQWHQEWVAAATVTDAVARRITEQYTKAADQLGSDKAPVRLAGLYALERLAQDNPEQRPTMVQVLCAYLRMPYELPGALLGPVPDLKEVQEHHDLVQERQVRLAAQRILAIHLRPGPDPDHTVATFWPGTILDLTDATLIDLDLTNCHLHAPLVSGARFAGDAKFDGAQFAGDAMFDGAEFAGTVSFDGVRFAGDAMFHGAQFAWQAVFDGARFVADAKFGKARFAKVAVFDRAQFTAVAAFTEAEFGENTRFNQAKFAGDTVFSKAQFARSVSFDEVRFVGNAKFDGAEFAGTASFDGARFAGDAMFHRAQFVADAKFDGAEFAGSVTFDEVRFVADARFGKARFAKVAVFDRA